MSAIESTYKSNDTEETLDKLFYRPIGYRVALAAKALGITPNGITITSIFTGIAAGWCFYYNNPYFLWIGIFLMLFSEMLDSADGQLARMTGAFSKVGRILDGMATYLMFFSVYISLTLRLIDSGYPMWIILVVLITLICHSLQSNISDFYRNCYLQFAQEESKGEILPSDKVKEDMINAKSYVDKILLLSYYQYTLIQESITKEYQILIRWLNVNGVKNKKEFCEEYKRLNKHNNKYYNILTTNTRMFALIIAMIINCPIAYLAFVLICLNILLIYVVVKQNIISKKLMMMINI